MERAEMKLIAALIAMAALAVAALCQTADAQTAECKSITDPATRLTCYDKANPPIATYPTPVPKPAARPVPVPKVDNTGYVDSVGDEEDARMHAQLRNICRGC
jgi:hypothetical protein